MAMLHDVYDSLRSMTLLHLLLAFLACTGYMVAEGQIAPKRVRIGAGLIAVASAGWFVIDSPQWTAGAMLVALAVGLVGVFTALVWAMSAALGLRQSAVFVPAPLTSTEVAEQGLAVAAAPDLRAALVNATRPGPLHSH
ncbi:MAG TPA: hypothetical protein VJO99_06850 [Burkholderiaceae bacterium]|nr:hypothetical protein [Burkholderiaceae bacterium]